MRNLNILNKISVGKHQYQVKKYKLEDQTDFLSQVL